MTRRASIKVIVPLLVAVTVAAAVVWLREPSRRQPIASDAVDRYALINVAPDFRGGRYAAVYRYYHANSSSSVTAVWIQSGSPPSIGSTAPAAGDPVATFTGSAEALRARWPQDSEHLVIEIDGITDTKTGPEAFEDCYFTERRTRNLVCYDDKKVELR